MRRGKNQVLYKYLPGKPIDYEQGKAIALVERWCSTKSNVENKQRLISKIYGAVRAFDLTRGFPKIANPDSFEILSPVFIEAELFPLTFVCDSCNRAYSFGSVQQFNRVLRRGRCYCGESLTQIDLVYTHECGNLWAPKVAPCRPDHGFENIILNKNNSNSPKDWRWECNICKKTTSLNSVCPNCLNSQIQYPKPFRQTSVFIPHSLTLVNLHNKDESKLQEDEAYRNLMLAQYLNLFLKHGTSFEDCLKESNADDNQFEMIIADLKKKGMPEDMINQLLESRDKVNPNKKEIRNKIFEEVRRLIKPVNGDTAAIALKAYEFMETLKESSSIHISDIIKYAKEKSYPNKERIETFPSIMESIGIKNSYVLNDLSIIKLVYGFTRGSSDEKKGITLNRFAPDRSIEQGKVPIYMNESSTEAILLEFDRWKILQWLKENKVIAELPLKNDEAELKAWFLNNVDDEGINPFNEIENDEKKKITRWIYKLLHSISHSLILTGSAECGLDKNSMSELINPSVPCIIIYSSNMQGFQMGGMFTLFENNIHSWIEKTISKVDNCIYDPVCMDHKTACHACLHLSEFSCTHMNLDLGRDFLIGKETPTDKITGFWSKDFLKRLKENDS